METLSGEWKLLVANGALGVNVGKGVGEGELDD